MVFCEFFRSEANVGGGALAAPPCKTAELLKGAQKSLPLQGEAPPKGKDKVSPIVPLFSSRREPSARYSRR